jgi:hypothetical protein
MKKSTCWIFLFLLVRAAAGQDQNGFERSRFELTSDFWFMNSEGTLRSSGTEVDLKNDLGFEQKKLNSVTKLTLKPGRKHRFIAEFTPYRLRGSNYLSRSITYDGNTYPVQDAIASQLDLTYLYAGYQYDIVSRRQGHFGLQFGAAYVKATGKIQSLRSNLVATDTETIPLPTIGAGFRAFPIPGSQRLSISGEARGLSVGRYGSFLQYHFEGGIYVFRGLTVRGGYRVLDVDVHTPDKDTMFSPRLAGPVISLEFRDR